MRADLVPEDLWKRVAPLLPRAPERRRRSPGRLRTMHLDHRAVGGAHVRTLKGGSRRPLAGRPRPSRFQAPPEGGARRFARFLSVAGLTCRAGQLAGLPLPSRPGSRQKAVAASAQRHTAVMSEESARLARALVEFRAAEGISERELARRTWLSHATIRTFERDRGELPPPTVARRFEEVLGWAPGSIKATPSEETGLEPSADSSSDLE